MRSASIPRSARRDFALVGLFVGLGGVVCLVGVDIAGRSEELIGAAAILLAAVGYSIGPMLLKHKLTGLEPLATMPGALVVGIVRAACRSPWPTFPERSALTDEAIASLIVLGVVCTAAAFIAFGKLIAAIGPGKALVITYVNPLVAVVAGVLVLGERPGPGALAGLLLIFAGSYLAEASFPPGART